MSNTTTRKHSMPTTIGGYENLLIRMVESRTESEFDEFLMPQVQTCAQCWMMLTKVHKDLMKLRSITSMVVGSQGQQKEEVSPLLPYYLKLQAELRLQFEALGLNYRATPSKIKEDTKKGASDSDPLSKLLKDVSNID